MTDTILNAAVLAAKEPQDWGLIWSTVFTGIIVVFLILVVLIAFLSLMGFIFKSVQKSKDEKAALKAKEAARARAAAQPAVKAPLAAALEITSAAEPEPEPEYEDVDDGEIIAVIAAAIAAFSEADGKQYRITGIKRQKTVRSGWSAAGIADNMRGF